MASPRKGEVLGLARSQDKGMGVGEGGAAVKVRLEDRSGQNCRGL